MLSFSLGQTSQETNLLLMEQPNNQMPLFKQVFSTKVNSRVMYVALVTGVVDGAYHVIKQAISSEPGDVLSFIGLSERTPLGPLCSASSQTGQQNSMMQVLGSGTQTRISTQVLNNVLNDNNVKSNSNLQPADLQNILNLLRNGQGGTSVSSFSSNSIVPKAVGILEQTNAPSSAFQIPSLNTQSAPQAISSTIITTTSSPLSSDPSISNLFDAIESLSPEERSSLQSKLNLGSLSNLTPLLTPPASVNKPAQYRYIRNKQFTIGGTLSGTGSDKVMNPTLQLVH